MSLCLDPPRWAFVSSLLGTFLSSHILRSHRGNQLFSHMDQTEKVLLPTAPSESQHFIVCMLWHNISFHNLLNLYNQIGEHLWDGVSGVGVFSINLKLNIHKFSRLLKENCQICLLFFHISSLSPERKINVIWSKCSMFWVNYCDCQEGFHLGNISLFFQFIFIHD